MPAAKYNITIEQGATWQQTFTYKDSNGDLVDLTNYTARMQVRESHASSASVVSLTSGAGIVLGGALGTIACTIDDAVTAALSAPQIGVWDLELENAAGVVRRLIEGDVFISPEVTR